MKTTSRRFGRATTPEVMDEGMGGGDYPVVVSDLSVDSPIQVIPDARPDELTVSADPPQYVDDDNFWGTGDKERKPRPWLHARRTWYVATAIGCILAIIATMVALNTGGGHQTKRVAFTFPVEAFPQSGVTVSRTWTLYGGAQPTLQGSLIFYSSRSDEVTVDELLPKSLVTKASQVTFLPKPKIVSEDPVVASYTIAPALDGVTSVTYQLPIPAGDFTLAALHRWASEQTAETGQRYLASHQLASVHITPASIVVKKGGAAYQLAVSGLQTDGQAAPTIAFGSATWSVANPKIAKVSSKGMVTGLAPGKTTVKAVVGKLSATANVVVSAAANVRATPPLKPLTAGALGTSLPNTTPSSIGPLPTSPASANHTPKKKPPVVAHPKPPVVIHSPPPVVVPPVITPPAVTCSPAAPTGVAASGGADGTSITVSWTTPAVPAGCTLSAYFVSGTGVAPQVLSGNDFTYTGLAAGSYSFSVSIGYDTVGAPVTSGAVGSNPVTIAGPPPPPVCANSPATGLSGTPTANPGEATIAWTSGVAGAPCTFSTESAVIDGGTPVGNGSTVSGLVTGPHTLTVTTSFSDGTIQTASAGFDVL
ncbi:MAG TPA: Ig-like domain-containing protein [Frankiaceae bacterium]|nr:Ig-like domain-containing protein [Frankiaceae bacterium]